ncbi:MAG: hypothetical protein EP336_09480 [Rhodobacteraceae bacterium]|nr:MAG: hypothetical protein EP336_09480 [Paracoccaceae bacterium]
MAFSAATVMARAARILLDEDSVRCGAQELRDWLNEGLRAIAAIKPNAKAENVILDLDAGGKQELPSKYTVLSRIIRNVGATPTNTPGKLVQTLNGHAQIDAIIPTWHQLPQSSIVSYVWQDLMALREFWVVPANDGTGRIEATVGLIPTLVPLPSTYPDEITSYTSDVDLPDVYQPIILDLILFRAFAKDEGSPDAAARSEKHLALANAGMSALSGGQNAVSLASAYA